MLSQIPCCHISAPIQQHLMLPAPRGHGIDSSVSISYQTMILILFSYHLSISKHFRFRVKSMKKAVRIRKIWLWVQFHKKNGLLKNGEEIVYSQFTPLSTLICVVFMNYLKLATLTLKTVTLYFHQMIQSIGECVAAIGVCVWFDDIMGDPDGRTP